MSFTARQIFSVARRHLSALIWCSLALVVQAAPAAVELEPGGAVLLHFTNGPAQNVRWESADKTIAEVYQNGFVIGLLPGQTRVLARNATGSAAEYTVVVRAPQLNLIDPATLQQYADERPFVVSGRKCFGSELNGQRASSPEEKRYTRANRVINPKPLREDKPLEWEVQPGTEIVDGAGILMGTVAPGLKVGERLVPTSKFNFGMSKVIDGRLCLYAFSVPIIPAPALAKRLEAASRDVATSAWLPLDRVVDKETLLERIGLGKPKLPALPLEPLVYRVTGGDPKRYVLAAGELSIVRDVGSGPVPSHYLRRPSGTVNILYSVPGFGLGGQGLDSFLAGDTFEFQPAKGAKVFIQPTYFPSRHPQAGKVSPQTMTFLYGAIKVKGAEPVYGWIAREALSETARSLD